MRVQGAVVWFDETVENLACRRGVLLSEDREFRETIAAMMIADTHPELEDPDDIREDDIDPPLVKAGLGVDVVSDDPDAVEDPESISASARKSDREISTNPVDQSRGGT